MNSCLKLLLPFIFCLACDIDGAKFRCDYKYCKFSKAWYKYHVIPSTWRDARLMCALEGAILASPISPEIRATMIKSTGILPIFTGLHSTFSKGKYYTVNGIPIEEIHHSWANFEPDNKHNSEDCLAINNEGYFLDVNCDDPRPYICYRDSSTDINACGTIDSEYQLESRTAKCYKFHAVPRTFNRAHFACSAEGGHLAIINSEEEAKVLRDLFTKYPATRMVGNFWKDVAFIGFHNWGERGEWRTIHGQTLYEAGYDRFSPGEPTNGTTGEFCGGIYRTGWLNDLWCDKPAAFICEKRPDYPPVCDDVDALARNR